VALEQLIEIVEGVGAGCYGTELLQEYLRKFVLDEIPIEEYCQWSMSEYTWQPVHRSERAELLVLCWQGNQRTAPHAHCGSWGMVTPYRGSLVNHLFEKTSGGRLKKLCQQTHRPGDVFLLKAEDIHQVTLAEDHQQEGGRISIHCYFPPLRVCADGGLEDGTELSCPCEMLHDSWSEKWLVRSG